MGFGERKLLYDQYETIRRRPLITYVTSIRPNLSSQMAGDSLSSIIEQVDKIPSDINEIDLLIVSNGGDPITALRIISILRERFKSIAVVVPYVAYSAATILALGADEIIMHPYSNLGPVDPQLTVPKQNDNGQPSSIQFSSEDIRNYIEFIKTDVGITDQAHLTTAFSALAHEVGPLPIGYSKRSQQLSLALSQKMLETHLKDKNKAETIAKTLNSSYYHHGYAVGRTEAKDIGLNVVFPQKETEDLIWAIWLDFCNEMKCNIQFDPINEIMADSTAKQKISSVSVISIPANTPPIIAQNLLTQAAQKSMTVIQQDPIEIRQIVASIESLRGGYVVQSVLNVVYWRDANMAISFNVTSYTEGWKSI